MPDSELSINPYAPSAPVPDESVGSETEPGDAQQPERASFPRTALRWLFVCGLSAIPSFVLGMAVTEGETAGMILGVLIFALFYTVVDFLTATRKFRQNPIVRRTLKIAYGTRIAISIVFPVGLYLDMFCGVISIGITQSVTGNELQLGDGLAFPLALLTTLVQGVSLNIVLAIYAGLVYVAQRVVIALRH